jgi:hypothetical protein
VLDDGCPPDIHINVEPATDVNPRVVIAGETLATMHKRRGTRGRVLDGRRASRLTAAHAVTLTVAGRQFKVTTLDLSAGGFSFCGEEPLREGMKLTAQFHSPPRSPAIRCVVRNCSVMENGEYRIGVAFVQCS